jgi:hypothetical protein
MPIKNGALVAQWSRQNPETGELEFALEKEDFEKVLQGYACGSCLADYGGMYLEKCPVCGEDRPGHEMVCSQWWTEASIIHPARRS